MKVKQHRTAAYQVRTEAVFADESPVSAPLDYLGTVTAPRSEVPVERAGSAGEVCYVPERRCWRERRYASMTKIWCSVPKDVFKWAR